MLELAQAGKFDLLDRILEQHDIPDTLLSQVFIQAYDTDMKAHRIH